MACKHANNDIKRAVHEMYATIVSNVDPKHVMDLLFEKDVITSDDFERIKNGNHTTIDRCRDLIQLLFKSPKPNAFVVLYHALITDYQSITKYIDTKIEEERTQKIDCTDVRGRSSCKQCWRIFGEYVDRMPMKICENGCVRCKQCLIKLQKSTNPCPVHHNSPILQSLIVDSSVLDHVKSYLSQLCDAEIKNQDSTYYRELEVICNKPYTEDCFADIFDATWKRKGKFVVKVPKVIDQLSCNDEEMKLFKLEANLASGMADHNIVGLTGLIRLNNNRVGIIMKKADNGSLKDLLTKGLDNCLAVDISFGILGGLKFLHNKQIAHFGLKPSNVLLFESDMTPKLTDFGYTKVIEKLFLRSKDRKYSAPELITSTYSGDAVDIYSFSVILFEMFSRQKAETLLGTTDDEIMESILMGKRKAIPEVDHFPKVLRQIVDRGWMPLSSDVTRPSLNDIEEALKKVEEIAPTLGASVITPTANDTQELKISTEEQCKETDEEQIPHPMVSSVKWDRSMDSSESIEMREEMVKNLKKKRLGQINDTVLNAMKIVPRHLFLKTDNSTIMLSQTGLEKAYNSTNPMPTSPTGKVNESSPEVIGSLLSLTDIAMGHTVLLVGVKGGYIQSVVAQLVGHYGSVLTVSSDSEMIEISQKRINDHCPGIFRDRIDWLHVPDVTNSADVADALRRRKLSFHAIIYCGRVELFPETMESVLRQVGQSSIVVPVDKERGNTSCQRMQILKKNGTKKEMRVINDFAFIFGNII